MTSPLGGCNRPKTCNGKFSHQDQQLKHRVPDPTSAIMSEASKIFYQLPDQGVFLNDWCYFDIEQELRPNSLSGKLRHREPKLLLGSDDLLGKNRSIHTRLGQQKF